MSITINGSTGVTFPDASTQAAAPYTKAESNLISVPAGMLMNFTGTTAPPGWLACPLVATNISRTTYAALFAAIGTVWGAGDGSTTFGCPWFPANYVEVQANGNVGTATVGDNLAHTHTLGAPVSGVLVQTGVSGYGMTGGATGSSGGSANLAAGHRVLKCVKI